MVKTWISEYYGHLFFCIYFFKYWNWRIWVFRFIFLIGKLKVCITVYTVFLLTWLLEARRLVPRTTDNQWRHKSKKYENLGQNGRQNILRPYPKIWEWEWIFGRVVKAISWPGVRSPCLVLYGARKVSDYDGVSNRAAIVVASAGTTTASAWVRGELRV